MMSAKFVPPLPEKQKQNPFPNTPQSIMGYEVKEQGFTDRLLCPTGLRWDATTRFLFWLLLFFGLVVPAWLPTARALEGGSSGGGGEAAAQRGGGGGSGGRPRLMLSVDGVVVVVCSLVGDGGIGGGGRGLLCGLCLCPWRRDGPHLVRVEGGSGDGGGSG